MSNGAPMRENKFGEEENLINVTTSPLDSSTNRFYQILNQGFSIKVPNSDETMRISLRVRFFKNSNDQNAFTQFVKLNEKERRELLNVLMERVGEKTTQSENYDNLFTTPHIDEKLNEKFSNSNDEDEITSTSTSTTSKVNLILVTEDENTINVESVETSTLNPLNGVVTKISDNFTFKQFDKTDLVNENENLTSSSHLNINVETQTVPINYEINKFPQNESSNWNDKEEESVMENIQSKIISMNEEMETTTTLISLIEKENEYDQETTTQNEGIYKF
jgi:hypothetical protein